MRYFLDVEFNEMDGELISLALVAEDGRELYLATHCAQPKSWVKENVIPILKCDGAKPIQVEPGLFGIAIANFMFDDPAPEVVADWPDDIKYFCRAIIVGPGQMVDIKALKFILVRIDAYPTDLLGAVQHNALWDARALRRAWRKSS